MKSLILRRADARCTVALRSCKGGWAGVVYEGHWDVWCCVFSWMFVVVVRSSTSILKSSCDPCYSPCLGVLPLLTVAFSSACAPKARTRSFRLLTSFNMPPKDKYTDPELRDQVKKEIQESDKGGAPGQWSARKVRSR